MTLLENVEERSDEDVRLRFYAANRSVKIMNVVHLLQQGVGRAERKEGRAGEGSRERETRRGRQTVTPRHLRKECWGGRDSQWDSLCEAQPTCCSSVATGSHADRGSSVTRAERHKHVAKTVPLRRAGCVPRDAYVLWI